MRRNHHRIPLVPRLAMLARLAEPRSAFTLIEMMIAVALSTVIIMTAVAAFRVVSRAINAADSMSVENSLLRIGFQASLDDVDFYHSEANDKAPYDKGFTRVRTQVADDPTTLDTDQYIRRHFQPIDFLASTDPDVWPYDVASDETNPASATWSNAYNHVINPNVFQASDPRSIDRFGIYGNQNPPEYYRYVTSTLMHGNYLNVVCTDMRYKGSASNSPRFPYDPASPNSPMPYKLALDVTTSPAWPYTAPIAYGEPTGGLVDVAVTNPVKTSYNQAVPLLGWQMYTRMREVGWMEYLPPCVSLEIMDQHGDWPNMNNSSPKGFPETSGPGGQDTVWWYNSYFSGSRDIANFLGLEYREARCYALATLPVIAAGAADTTSSGWGLAGGYDGTAFICGMINQGEESGYFHNPNQLTADTYHLTTGDVGRNDLLHTSRTVRLPYNRSDGERSSFNAGSWSMRANRNVPIYTPTPLDFDTKPSKYPILSTTILRYHRLGGLALVTLATTSVEDPTTGRRVELSMTPLGTSFRGARQHWRLYSPAYTSTTAIGDFYGTDTAAGPFYNP